MSLKYRREAANWLKGIFVENQKYEEASNMRDIERSCWIEENGEIPKNGSRLSSPRVCYTHQPLEFLEELVRLVDEENLMEIKVNSWKQPKEPTDIIDFKAYFRDIKLHYLTKSLE